MLNTSKILKLLLVFGLCCNLYAEDQATDIPREVPAANKPIGVGINDHCHAHRTPHGCLKRQSCYWDYYQNRCLYR